MTEDHAAGMSPRGLGATAVQAAALASPIPVLLFLRADIAHRLGRSGNLTGELAVLGGIAVVAALGVPRLRNTLPAGAGWVLGGVLATVGLALMAGAGRTSTFVVGTALLGVGAAPALVTHRVVLAVDGHQGARFRTLSWYWAAVSAGAAWPLVIGIFGSVADDHLLWACTGLMAAATVLVAPHALAHDDDVNVERSVARTDVPWARRSYAAAATVGAVVIGGAVPAQSLLEGEWQRSDAQTAAVLAVGVVAAALISALGPWYHRLHRLRGDRRADAVGTQFLLAGALVALGGVSFTYIGLIVCWGVAGGAVALAAAGTDAAVFPTVAPSLRRAVAARQVLWAGIGAFGAVAINAWVIGGWSDQWRIAWTGLPLVAVGWAVRRFAASARDAELDTTRLDATTVPRRVYEHAGADQPPVLSVEEVSVAYGPVQVLFDVDVRVDEGTVVALLGTNGAGKTTLLRAVSGLEPTIGGRIVYTGLDVTNTRPTWRVGMGLHQVVGGHAVVDSLTVDENLRLFAHGLSGSRRTEGLAEALALFPRLAERAGQRAATLSGGEKQMLALAKAVMVPPRLLLIDEFSLGLAPSVIADLLPVLRGIAEGGASVLLVEQSANIALSVADQVYVMQKGSIVHSGPARDARDRPDLLQAAYLTGVAQAPAPSP